MADEKRQEALALMGNKMMTLPPHMQAAIAGARQQMDMLDVLFATVLEEGIDYGRLPGIDKPGLFLPGAQRICQVFHFQTGEPVVEREENLEKGWFSYIVKTPFYKINPDTGEHVVMGWGVGAANSYETKYRYRNVDKVDEEGKVVKDEHGRAVKVRVPNADPADQQNTLVKMSSKRSYVGGALNCSGASRYFTQDVEDMPWLGPEMAGAKQKTYVSDLMRERGKTDADLAELTGREDALTIDDITRQEATELIDRLKAMPKGRGGQKKPPQASPTEQATPADEPATDLQKSSLRKSCAGWTPAQKDAAFLAATGKVRSDEITRQDAARLIAYLTQNPAPPAPVGAPAPGGLAAAASPAEEPPEPPPASLPQTTAPSSDKPTEKQWDKLHGLARTKGVFDQLEPLAETMFQKPKADLSKREVSQFIDYLKDLDLSQPAGTEDGSDIPF